MSRELAAWRSTVDVGFIWLPKPTSFSSPLSQPAQHHHTDPLKNFLTQRIAGVFGPVATTWLGFLARRVTFRNARVETAARVAADQLLFAPVMIGVFLGSMATMEGKSPSKRLETTWWPALKANWVLWPAVQFVNFTFLPLQYRLLFANVISIGWNSYLSWVNSKGGNKSKDHELVAAPAT